MIKHLTPRSEEEIRLNLSRLSPEERIHDNILLHWKHLKFKEKSGPEFKLGNAEFELTYKTGKWFTVKVHAFPKNPKSSLTLSACAFRFSTDEFLISLDNLITIFSLRHVQIDSCFF